MNPQHDTPSVVYTRTARCRDCHRCLRACPVKAIRIVDGQASVVGELCIECGTCIRECPQHAKTYRTELDRVKGWIAAGAIVAASVAPSFASILEQPEVRRLPSALRRLGFKYVGETATAASWVARRARETFEAHPDTLHLWTSCPSAVSWIETQRPDLLPLLIPVTSPMVAHGRYVASRLAPGSKVVFIGPCIAKKAERRRSDNEGVIDAVLTFEELIDWMGQERVALSECEDSAFDDAPESPARAYPLERGSLHTAGVGAEPIQGHVVSVCGVDQIRELLEGIGPESRGLVELLFCRNGCIGGPATGRCRGVLARRDAVVEWSAQPAPSPTLQPKGLRLDAAYDAEHRVPRSFTEEEIRAVLERTGKSRPEDQLDCGACGYSSCRAKAIAVLRGMVDPGVCIPVMRRLAEQRSDRIMDTSPNGIVILDQRLCVLGTNPAFRTLFRCTEAACGKHVSELMDPEPFLQLAAGRAPRLETTVRHAKQGIVCHEILYALPEDGQYVGIFVNVTQTERERESLERLRSQTLAQGRELLQHQFEMAQQVTRFLGESTAKGELLVQNLLKVARDPSDDDRGGAMERIWDTYTSK